MLVILSALINDYISKSSFEMFLIFVAFFVQICTAFAATPASLCQNQKFSYSEYSPTDPTLNMTSMITLSLSCGKPLEKPLSLYGWISVSNRIIIGVVDSKLISPYTYQFSLTTEELNELPTGSLELRILDDEGLALLRKASFLFVYIKSSMGVSFKPKFCFRLSVTDSTP
jgi:hypothetical protein